MAMMAMGQNSSRTGISGTVVDGYTGETLPFVQIYFLQSTENRGMIPSDIGTSSDLDGNFSLSNTAGYTRLNFQMLGYKTEMVTLRPGQNRKDVKIKMHPDVYGLQDIVVTPKNSKRDYKRKGNPAVELIKNVIANKDKHCVTTSEQYTAKTYSRMSFALDNIKMNFKKGFWKNFAFVEKYIDSTGVYPNVTVSIREHIGEEYYQRKPHREKKVLQKKRIFGIEDILASGTFKQATDAIFKEVEINDNSMNLLFNRFVSPLSSTIAVTFYQYYIMDTIMVDGYPCIDLAFVPVNSESYGFTGHLYVVNDSTYRLKKYAINIPPDINLNFVSNYSLEASYKQLENGLWAPDRISTYAKFYLINQKRGMLARQTKIYTGWDLETPISKETFSGVTTTENNDSSAVRVGSRKWDALRPEPLSWYESSVVDLVNEFTNTPKFNSLALTANAIMTEYIPTTKAKYMHDSKFDIGPIFSFASWNMLEGVRLRFGGMSTADLHPNVYFRTYLAFGTKDLRPKYEATLFYTFDKHKKHPYDGLRHHLRWTAQYDVEEPGQSLDMIERDHILNSIPTSKPVMGFYQYVFRAKMEYMKEWENNLYFRTSFDFTNNEAAGSLRYDRVQYSMNSDSTWTKSFSNIGQYRNYEGMVELQYSPGVRPYLDRMGKASSFGMEKDAPILRLTHYIGYLDDRHNGGNGFFYNKTEFLFEKRFWFSAFGHLDTRVYSGMIWQKAPFTKLYIPNTSTSIFLSLRGFNQMKPMEFIMDQYVGIQLTYYFKGWIMNRIPGLNKLKLRGVISFSGIYGGLSKKNNPYLETGSGLYDLPHTPWKDGNIENAFDNSGYIRDSYRTTSPLGKLPYMEFTAGFENILKFIRIDYIRRLTYNDYELPYMIQKRDGAGVPMFDENGNPVMVHGRKKIGAWGRNGVKITVRIAL